MRQAADRDPPNVDLMRGPVERNAFRRIHDLRDVIVQVGQVVDDPGGPPLSSAKTRRKLCIQEEKPHALQAG